MEPGWGSENGLGLHTQDFLLDPIQQTIQLGVALFLPLFIL
jgi:hypothetical protein